MTDQTSSHTSAAQRDAQAIVDLSRRANSILHHVMSEGQESSWSEPIVVDAIAGARDLVSRARALLEQRLDIEIAGSWNSLPDQRSRGFPDVSAELCFGREIRGTGEFPIDLVSTCLSRALAVLTLAAEFMPENKDERRARHDGLWAVNGELYTIERIAELVTWLDAGASVRRAA